VTADGSEVVATVAVGVPALEGLVTALSTTFTLWLAGIALVPDMKQVATWVVLLTLQNPIELVVETVVSYTCPFWKVDRSVVDGNVIVIWLFAAEDIPPVEDVVNVTAYTVRAPAAFDGELLSTATFETCCAATTE
jgi:hypothetical protein